MDLEISICKDALQIFNFLFFLISKFQKINKQKLQLQNLYLNVLDFLNLLSSKKKIEKILEICARFKDSNEFIKQDVTHKKLIKKKFVFLRILT